MAGSPPDSAISIRRVSRQLAGRAILQDIDLEIAHGEFFALVGPSGSGKSTLLKMVSGIDSPTSGEVWLEGENVTAAPPYRRAVHTVFQNYALFPHLTVAGNVGFPLMVAGAPRKERQERVLRALALVKMERFAERAIGNLSGGERQRVAVARALVDEPRCILFDEPLSALDPHLRVSTLEMIQEIQDRLGITYLYVTHDRQEALRAAGRVAVLKDGAVRQVGAPQELYHRPNSSFVASFLGPMNWLTAERAAHEGKPAARLANGATIPLGERELPASGSLLLGLRPEDVEVCEAGPLAGTVVSCDFCGATTHIRVEVSAGVQLVADVRDPPSGLSRGAAVRLSWNPAALHAFDAAEAPAHINPSQ